MPNWRWALNSPARLALTIVGVLVVVWGASTVLSPRQPPAKPAAVRSAPATGTSTPSPPPTTASPTRTASPTPSPTRTIPPLHPTTPTLPAAQARAMTRFVTAWASHEPAHSWYAHIHPLVDAEVAAGLARTNPATIAATKVTGQPHASIVGPRGSEAVVPTDAGPVALRCGLYGRRWLITLIEQG